MRKMLFWVLIIFVVVSFIWADWYFNPETGTIDYYEPVSGSNLGDLGDVTFILTTRGDIIYRGATAWNNLAKGTSGQALIIGANDPAWGTLGATYGGTGQNSSAWTGVPSIAAGVWGNNAQLPVSLGGTGLSSYTIGDILYASGAGTLAGLADVTVNQVLTSGGVGVAPAWSASPSLTNITISDKIIETVNAHGTVSSGTEDFDLDDGTYHTVTAGGNFTVTFSNWPASGKVSSITLKLTNAGAHTITWPATVDWPGGVEPAWTAAGTDFAIFFTDDGGTIVNGMRSLQDVK